jgi:hypothetical protein
VCGVVRLEAGMAETLPCCDREQALVRMAWVGLGLELGNMKLLVITSWHPEALHFWLRTCMVALWRWIDRG